MAPGFYKTEIIEYISFRDLIHCTFFGQ